MNGRRMAVVVRLGMYRTTLPVIVGEVNYA